MNPPCAPSDHVHRRLQAGMSYGHHTSTSSKRSMHGEPHKSLSSHEVCITKKSRMMRLRDMRGFVLRWSANKQARHCSTCVLSPLQSNVGGLFPFAHPLSSGGLIQATRGLRMKSGGHSLITTHRSLNRENQFQVITYPALSHAVLAELLSAWSPAPAARRPRHYQTPAGRR
jgi:hypothetical protein